MNPDPTLSNRSRLESVSLVASGSVAGIGLLVLAGWAFDWPGLCRWGAHLVAMKANTALGFVLVGVALWVAQRQHVDRRRLRIFGCTCAVIVALLGLLSLVEDLGAVNLRLDELLVTDTLGDGPPGHPGRLAPNTAVCFVLLGAALWMVDAETRGRRRPVQYLALAVGLVSLEVLVGYVYGVVGLCAVSARHIPMALGTAVALALSAVGVLLARPDRGLMAAVTGDHAGGLMMRRLLVPLLAFPIVLDLALHGGLAQGWLSDQSAGAVHTVLLMLAFVTVLGLTARSLNRADAARWLAAIVDSSDDAIVSKDVQGIIRTWNPAAERLFGYTAREVIGRHIGLLIPADQRGEEAIILERLRQGDHIEHYEAVRLRKDGTPLAVSLTISPVRDASGKIVAASKIIRDITERKRAQLAIQTLNAELEQRVRARTAELEVANKELEAFAYSVSHDLRAPLRTVDGFSHALLEEYGSQLSGEGPHFLQAIREGAQQMGALIDDLLSFSRLSRQALAKQAVDTNQLVRLVVAELQPQQNGRQVELRVGDLPACAGDPALLKQVWVNLLSNALKYTHKRERAVIEVGVMPEPTAAPRTPPAPNTPALPQTPPPVFFVRDNGVGFNMRYAHKLFGVFQRLHRAEEYEGTGVGLAIVQRVLHRHGGRVWAEAEVDRGATFYFTLEGTDPL